MDSLASWSSRARPPFVRAKSVSVLAPRQSVGDVYTEEFAVLMKTWKMGPRSASMPEQGSELEVNGLVANPGLRSSVEGQSEKEARRGRRLTTEGRPATKRKACSHAEAHRRRRVSWQPLQPKYSFDSHIRGHKVAACSKAIEA